MIFEWLSDALCEVLRWRLANPGSDPRDGPEMPPAGYRLWRIFNDLHQSRAVGFAPCAITHAEIDAWSRLHREPVRPFEVEIIRALDATYMERQRAASEERDGKAIPRSSGQAVTPAAFDAVFR
jgi:hypothetical protein